MIDKQELLECSIRNFIKFGSKRFSMNELASKLGISKKTIYKHFKTKDELVAKGVRLLTDKYLHEVDKIKKNNEDPLLKIILIKKTSFQYLNYFKPSFLYSCLSSAVVCALRVFKFALYSTRTCSSRIHN